VGSIEIIALLRAVLYGVLAVFAYISRSLLATSAAIVLFFLPIVQQYGSRQLAIEYSVLTTLVAALLIYRVVKYENEIRRLVLIIADAKPKASEQARYHVRRFGKAMGAALACMFLILGGVVLKDILEVTPETQDQQPLPTPPPPSPTSGPTTPPTVSAPGPGASTVTTSFSQPAAMSGPQGAIQGPAGPPGPTGPGPGTLPPGILPPAVDPATAAICNVTMICLR
jgi:hypothetical protein